MFNALDVFQSCCNVCDNCESYPPPTEAEVAWPWDCLAVQHLESSLVLRRCCSVSTPLLGAMGGYTTGQTVPFWQPSDTGPTLGGTGQRSLGATRSVSSRLGPDTENQSDCSGQPAMPGDPSLGGSRAIEDPGGACVRGSDKIGATYYEWSDFNGFLVDYVRVTQPDADGNRYVIYEESSEANGSAEDGRGVNWFVWDLQTGTNYCYGTTDDYVTTASSRALAAGFGISTRVARAGAGAKLCVGPNSRRLMMLYEPGNHELTLETIPFDRATGDGWIKDAVHTSQGVQTIDYTSGVTAVCWQWDNTDYYLEVERTGGKTVIYRNGPGGRRRIYTSDEADLLPIHYRRDGKRHVFLATTSTETFRQEQYACNLLFDVTEGGAECGTPDVTDLTAEGNPGSSYFVEIGPEGEIALVGPDHVSRLASWSLAIDGAAPGYAQSITRGTYNGWYHVRGIRYNDGDSLYDPSKMHPGPDSNDPAFSVETTIHTQLLIPPEGPGATEENLVFPRQFSADNTGWGTGPTDDPADGTQKMQFVGHQWLGEFDSLDDTRLKAMDWYAVLSSTDGLPVASTAHGVIADPTLPAHYGPAASGAF